VTGRVLKMNLQGIPMESKKKNKKSKQNKNKKRKRGTPIRFVRTGPRTIVGHGDYQVNPALNEVIKTLGGMGTNYLGLGSDLGRNLGDSAHRAFKAITGYGDYKVKSNTLATDTGAPIFKPQDRIMHIRHREFVGDIKSGGSGTPSLFDSRTFPIHPSNSTLFPWLSTIAKNFQQYRFRGLIFSFESKSGNATGSNTSLGTVIMSTDYNVKPGYISVTGGGGNAIPFRTKQEMEAHEFSTSTVPSQNMIHPVECAPSEQILQHLSVWNKQIGTTEIEDVKFYIHGVMQLSTVGMPNNGTNLGELWVSYDIELLKARIEPPKINSHWYFSGNINSGYLPPTQVSYTSNGSAFSINPTTGVITIDSGFYGTIRLTIFLASPGGAIVGYPSPTLSSTVVEDADFKGDTVGQVVSYSTTTMITLMQFFVAGGGTISLSNSYCTSDTLSIADVFIDAIPDDLSL